MYRIVFLYLGTVFRKVSLQFLISQFLSGGHVLYQYCSLINVCEIKVCPKTWAYFTLKLGWFKTTAGTNMGPQSDLYLSAPEVCRINRIKEAKHLDPVTQTEGRGFHQTL